MASTYQESVEKTIIAAEQLHRIVNGTATTDVPVQDGSAIPSIRKALLDNFYFKEPLPWQQGQNETTFNQLRKTTDGLMWYAPNASVSSPITMGVAPTESSGWKIYSLDAIVKLESTIREALRRTYAEAGYNLVAGSFEKGGVISNVNDVLMSSKTGLVYKCPIGAVAAGTDPLTAPYTDISSKLLVSIIPAYVEYYRVISPSDTAAIDLAMAASKMVIFGNRKYTYTKELVSTGHTLIGAVSETFSSQGTTIEFDLQQTPASGFAFRNKSLKGCVEGIKFIQKSWNVPLNGFKPDRFISGKNISFSYFNGHGVVLTSVDSKSESCYGTTLENITCDYNAKHGILLGGAANAVIIKNPICRWNGSPSYGTAPSVADNFDGIYSGGKNSEYPGNPGIFNDPQGVVIIGGDISYNSRKGLNLDRFFDGLVSGGYAEANKNGDIDIKTMFGSVINNFMGQSVPSFNLPNVDPLDSTTRITDYPNSIVIRGRNYGIGQQSSTHGVYDTFMPAMKYLGTAGSFKIRPTAVGGVQCEQNGGPSINWNFGDLPVAARKAAFGDGIVDGTPISSQHVIIRRAGDAEGLDALTIVNGAQFMKMYVANGSGANGAGTAMLIPKNSSTNRSINAGGTVNTSGADYAEYMTKAATCGVIEKGAICGVDISGMLTDKFDDSISFVIKSTDPSFVGGDTWFKEEEPEIPIGENGEKNTADPDYILALNGYRARMESARLTVDRIAFSGQVPCNVYDTKVGGYIVPIRTKSGGISGICITDPSLNDYISSVGKVWKIMDDGRAWVAVKIA